MTIELRQTFVRVRVRSLIEEDGQWGSTTKSWQTVANSKKRRLLSLVTVGGDRRLARMGAEYEADWFALTRAKPEINQGDLIETLDANDNAINRFIVKKRLHRGRNVGLMLEENPNIQEDG